MDYRNKHKNETNQRGGFKVGDRVIVSDSTTGSHEGIINRRDRDMGNWVVRMDDGDRNVVVNENLMRLHPDEYSLAGVKRDDRVYVIGGIIHEGKYGTVRGVLDELARVRFDDGVTADLALRDLVGERYDLSPRFRSGDKVELPDGRIGTIGRAMDDGSRPFARWEVVVNNGRDPEIVNDRDLRKHNRQQISINSHVRVKVGSNPYPGDEGVVAQQLPGGERKVVVEFNTGEKVIYHECDLEAIEARGDTGDPMDAFLSVPTVPLDSPPGFTGRPGGPSDLPPARPAGDGDEEAGPDDDPFEDDDGDGPGVGWVSGDGNDDDDRNDPAPIFTSLGRRGDEGSFTVPSEYGSIKTGYLASYGGSPVLIVSAERGRITFRNTRGDYMSHSSDRRLHQVRGTKAVPSKQYLYGTRATIPQLDNERVMVGSHRADGKYLVIFDNHQVHSVDASYLVPIEVDDEPDTNDPPLEYGDRVKVERYGGFPRVNDTMMVGQVPAHRDDKWRIVVFEDGMESVYPVSMLVRSENKPARLRPNSQNLSYGHRVSINVGVLNGQYAMVGTDFHFTTARVNGFDDKSAEGRMVWVVLEDGRLCPFPVDHLSKMPVPEGDKIHLYSGARVNIHDGALPYGGQVAMVLRPFVPSGDDPSSDGEPDMWMVVLGDGSMCPFHTVDLKPFSFRFDTEDISPLPARRDVKLRVRDYGFPYPGAVGIFKGMGDVGGKRMARLYFEYDDVTYYYPLNMIDHTDERLTVEARRMAARTSVVERIAEAERDVERRRRTREREAALEVEAADRERRQREIGARLLQRDRRIAMEKERPSAAVDREAELLLRRDKRQAKARDERERQRAAAEREAARLAEEERRLAMERESQRVATMKKLTPRESPARKPRSRPTPGELMRKRRAASAAAAAEEKRNRDLRVKKQELDAVRSEERRLRAAERARARPSSGYPSGVLNVSSMLACHPSAAECRDKFEECSGDPGCEGGLLADLALQEDCLYGGPGCPVVPRCDPDAVGCEGMSVEAALLKAYEPPAKLAHHVRYDDRAARREMKREAGLGPVATRLRDVHHSPSEMQRGQDVEVLSSHGGVRVAGVIIEKIGSAASGSQTYLVQESNPFGLTPAPREISADQLRKISGAEHKRILREATA